MSIGRGVFSRERRGFVAGGSSPSPPFGMVDAKAKAALGLAPGKAGSNATNTSYSVPVEREGYEDPGARFRADAEMLRRWHAQVIAAQVAFEGRFTHAALAHVDAVFATTLRKQHDLFVAACVRSNPGEIEKHGAATVRGYEKALRMLLEQKAEDDAYRVYPARGDRAAVAVAFDRAPVGRVLQQHGHLVAFFTVAELFELVDDRRLEAAIAAKMAFPGAEVMPKGGET